MEDLATAFALLVAGLSSRALFEGYVRPRLARAGAALRALLGPGPVLLESPSPETIVRLPGAAQIVEDHAAMIGPGFVILDRDDGSQPELDEQRN